MAMSIRSWALLSAAMFAASWGYGHTRYLAGWYAHTEHMNQLAHEKRNRASVALQVTETTAAAASAERQIVYKTVYRDVVKYVSKPDRTKCSFDDDAIRMRQRAIDAANHIAGFDDETVPDK